VLLNIYLNFHSLEVLFKYDVHISNDFTYNEEPLTNLVGNNCILTVNCNNGLSMADTRNIFLISEKSDVTKKDFIVRSNQNFFQNIMLIFY